MKKINYKIIAGFILLAIVISSCKKWVNPDINQNPNQPADAALNSILPVAEANMAYQTGGDLAYPARLWMQQIAGDGNQMLAYDNYNFNSSESDAAWQNMYAYSMVDLYTMIQKAKDQSSPYYGGIAKVLMAYALGCVTDLYGDMPYSQAFQGRANLSPAFDKQQQVYASINSLLSSAITDLSASTSLLSPGADDIIYGGDVTKWTEAAYALQARYAIHLSKVNGASAYTTALTALTNAFTANTDDMEFKFGTSSNNSAPIYQFLNQRGDYESAEFIVDTLFNANDPRATVFIDTTGVGAIGSVPGEGDWPTATIGSYYAAPNAPVPFISYVECLFIKAEAEFQTNDKIDAAPDFNKAVKASLAKYNVSTPAWEAIYANETTASITLEKIMTQKYIALYLQLEVYNDWRRTGFPSHIADNSPNLPALNTNNNIVPRRYPYPTSEKEYNKNCPTSGASLSDKVWWNQ
jgi:hypothetical protein